MEELSLFLQDKYVFPAFQLAILLALCYGVLKELGWLRRRRSVTLSVQRGQESWNSFHLVYVLLVVVIVEVNNTAESLKHYKTAITLADLAALSYLCFFNTWFRNLVLGIINSSRGKVER